MTDFESWRLFILASVFGGTGAALRGANDLLSLKRNSKLSKLDILAFLLNIFTMLFLAGLGGWACALAWPVLTADHPELVAIFAGLLALQGRERALEWLRHADELLSNSVFLQKNVIHLNL